MKINISANVPSFSMTSPNTTKNRLGVLALNAGEEGHGFNPQLINAESFETGSHCFSDVCICIQSHSYDRPRAHGRESVFA